VARIKSTVATVWLKLALGRYGRADWAEKAPGLPGDIVYYRERVVVFVLDCNLYGCTRHNVKVVEGLKPLANEALARLRDITDKYERSQWVVFTYHECQVLDNIAGVVGEIIEVLAKRTPPYGVWGFDGKADDRCAAAMVDAVARFGSLKWMAFLELVYGATQADGDKAKRSRVDYALVDSGWRRSECEDAWKVAVHHGVLQLKEDGTFSKGEWFVPVLYACGMVEA